MYDSNNRYAVAISYSWEPSEELIMIHPCKNAWTQLVKLVCKDMVKAQNEHIKTTCSIDKTNHTAIITYTEKQTKCYYKLIPDKKETITRASKKRRKPRRHIN